LVFCLAGLCYFSPPLKNEYKNVIQYLTIEYYWLESFLLTLFNQGYYLPVENSLLRGKITVQE